MKEINLKLTTKIIDCEVRKVKFDVVFEQPEIEVVISKKAMRAAEKLLIEELKKQT